MMITICKKDYCVWRVDCGNGKSICSRYNCPYLGSSIKVEKLPPIKWAGLLDKTVEYFKYAKGKQK